MPIFQVPTPYGRRNGKKWVKTLTKVDTNKRDGYAFEGAFLTVGELAELPVGTWLLLFGRDAASSGKVYDAEVWLMRVKEDGPVDVESWKIPSSRVKSWALECRDDIAAIVNEPDTPDVEALQAERAKLAARIEEIDKILGA